MRLAADLARALDALLIEGVAPHALRAIALAPELAEHWQASLGVLAAILDRWPAELAALGRIDAADRRNRLLTRVAGRWRETPPAGFVVAAGIGDAAPAVAGLLRTVAWMPRGMVVLAGLDQAMPEEEWGGAASAKAGAGDRGGIRSSTSAGCSTRSGSRMARCGAGAMAAVVSAMRRRCAVAR